MYEIFWWLKNSMKSYLSLRQNPIQSIYFVIGSKFHFSSQQMPPKNKYTDSPKKWTWKLPWRKNVPRCLLVDKTERNNSILIIISRCLIIISCEILVLNDHIIFFQNVIPLKKCYSLMNFCQLYQQLSCLYIICFWISVSESLFGIQK